MKKRPLGKSGIEIAPIAFGGNVFGWTADEAMSFRLLDQFVDAGFNCIDTADCYSTWVPGHPGGESETVIGKWLKKSGKRQKVVIATKVGFPMGQNKGLGRGWIPRACEDSLRRLGIETIDLYQSHFDDESVPVEETMEAFDGLVKAGKVRAIGASQVPPTRLRESFEISARKNLAHYVSLQPIYNLYDRATFENDYAGICREFNLGVISFYPLAAGFLTGKYRDAADLVGSARGEGIESVT